MTNPTVDNDELSWTNHPGRPCDGDPRWTSDDKHEVGEAARLCHVKACPVLQQCGRWAFDNGERHHVWGGLNFSSKPVRAQVTAHLAEKAIEVLERQIRDLHRQGLSDSTIGLRIGKSPGEVHKLRRRFGLPALYGPGGQPVKTEVAA